MLKVEKELNKKPETMVIQYACGGVSSINLWYCTDYLKPPKSMNQRARIKNFARQFYVLISMTSHAA